MREVRLMTLNLYEDYSRQAVHDLFDPDSPFAPGAGKWGLHGIVQWPDRPSDFVFFLRSIDRDHRFDEGITPDGVLSWQSQPNQGFDSRVIKELIAHDELSSNIYLFPRTSTSGPYTYLGRLKYLRHDASRQRPVYFQWQILDWNPRDEMLRRMGLVLDRAADEPPEAKYSPLSGGSIVVPPPRSNPRQGQGVDTRAFRARRVPNRAERDAANRSLGLAGERFVAELERMALVAMGRADLAARVRHVAVELGDGEGYDVLSFDHDGEPKHIEVKTTLGPSETDFFISENERAFARQAANTYYFYRVHNFDEAAKTGDIYMVRGALEDNFTLTSANYRARR
jgi:hypothetical protein